jgi:hypothetical protein
MRIAPVMIFLALASARAYADDEAPVAQPTKQIDTADSLCPAVRGDLDAKLPCKRFGKAKLGGATVEGVSVTDPSSVTHYAILITDGDKMSVSQPVEVMLGDCAMMKCLVVDKTTPKLHAVRKGALVVLEVAVTEHMRHTDPETGKQRNDPPRHNVYVIACSKSEAGPPTCLARQVGDETQRSCTGTVDADGNLVTTCEDSEYLGL